MVPVWSAGVLVRGRLPSENDNGGSCLDLVGVSTMESWTKREFSLSADNSLAFILFGDNSDVSLLVFWSLLFLLSFSTVSVWVDILFRCINIITQWSYVGRNVLLYMEYSKNNGPRVFLKYLYSHRCSFAIHILFRCGGWRDIFLSPEPYCPTSMAAMTPSSLEYTLIISWIGKHIFLM